MWRTRRAGCALVQEQERARVVVPYPAVDVAGPAPVRVANPQHAVGGVQIAVYAVAPVLGRGVDSPLGVDLEVDVVVDVTRSHDRVVLPPRGVGVSVVVHGEVIAGLARLVVLVAPHQADLGAEGDHRGDVIETNGRAPTRGDERFDPAGGVAAPGVGEVYPAQPAAFG